MLAAFFGFEEYNPTETAFLGVFVSGSYLLLAHTIKIVICGVFVRLNGICIC